MLLSRVPTDRQQCLHFFGLVSLGNRGLALGHVLSLWSWSWCRSSYFGLASNTDLISQNVTAFTSEAFRHVGFQDETAKHCSQRQRKVAFSTQRYMPVSCGKIAHHNTWCNDRKLYSINIEGVQQKRNPEVRQGRHFVRPPDIVVGGLIFYQRFFLFFLLSAFFFLFSPSNLSARWIELNHIRPHGRK